MGRLTKREGNSVRIGGLVLEKDEAWHKLAHYEDLEEQGRLIEQKFGYWIEADDGDGDVCSVCGTDFCTMVYSTERFNYCPVCRAKIVTKEEAEAKLKELEGE